MNLYFSVSLIIKCYILITLILKSKRMEGSIWKEYSRIAYLSKATNISSKKNEDFATAGTEGTAR